MVNQVSGQFACVIGIGNRDGQRGSCVSYKVVVPKTRIARIALVAARKNLGLNKPCGLTREQADELAAATNRLINERSKRP